MLNPNQNRTRSLSNSFSRPLAPKETYHQHESVAPPEFPPDQASKGGFALKKLKKYCEEIYLANKRTRVLI